MVREALGVTGKRDAVISGAGFTGQRHFAAAERAPLPNGCTWMAAIQAHFEEPAAIAHLRTAATGKV